MKSNVRPRMTMRSMTASSGLGGRAGMFERDVAQYNSDPLGLVGGVFQELVNVVPTHRLDQLRHLGYPVVQVGDRVREQVVALVLQAMDLLRGMVHGLRVAALFEQRHRFGDLLALFEDDLAELPGNRRWLVEPIQADAARDFLDPVDDVVQRRGQVADVLAVERGDEGAGEGAE